MLHTQAVRNDHLYHHLLIGFGLALGIYLVMFTCDQTVRKRKGAWEVRFGETNGEPMIRISQAALRVTNVQVIFEGETVTNGMGEVQFDRPKKDLPFGKTKFEDLTYLPGSVAFDFFGHEVELLPRTLYLNKKEQPWKSGEVFRLKPEEKLPPESFTDPKKKKRRFG